MLCTTANEYKAHLRKYMGKAFINRERIVTAKAKNQNKGKILHTSIQVLRFKSQEFKLSAFCN